jgi:hypothetical protein
MTKAHRSIFRENALRRYRDGKVQPVLPRFISHRTFIWLWILLRILLVSGVVVSLMIIGQLGV